MTGFIPMPTNENMIPDLINTFVNYLLLGLTMLVIYWSAWQSGRSERQKFNKTLAQLRRMYWSLGIEDLEADFPREKRPFE
jgi:hypothetical protein